MRREVFMMKALTVLKLVGIVAGTYYGGKYLIRVARKK